MTIITEYYRSFEDEVLSNLSRVSQPGEIVHSFGEFVIIPPKGDIQEINWLITNNTSTSSNIERTNVKLA